MSELKIPDDLNTRYKLAKAQLAILPSIDDDLDDLFLGTRYQCEEVIQLIERIAALEAALDEFNAGWKSCIKDLRKSEEICRTLETAMAQLRRQIAALEAPVSDEEWEANSGYKFSITGCAEEVVTPRWAVNALIAARAKETL